MGIVKKGVMFSAAALIVILAIGIYAANRPGNPMLEYRGHSFEKKDGYWFTEIERDGKDVEIAFKLNPAQVGHVEVIGKYDPSFVSSETYISQSVGNQSSRDEVLSYVELRENTKSGLGIELKNSCVSNKTYVEVHCASFPSVDCNSGKKVILIRPLGTAEIRYEGDCVIVSGKDNEMQRAIDYLLYQWLNFTEDGK